MNTLHIRQDAPSDGFHLIRLTLRRPGQPDQQAEAKVQFVLSDQEQEDLRWYLEDYLQRADSVEAVTVQQIEAMMKVRGEELYTKILTANARTQALWFSTRNDLADLRIEITTDVAGAASIPWELMRDPEAGSAISLRVKSFVRVQSNPNISFTPAPSVRDGTVRLLYIVCRPSGAEDVELRAVANRLLQDLGAERARFEIKALRPPTFEQLQMELIDAKEAGRPYHIVHFDGHGVYADLSSSVLADWAAALSSVTLGGGTSGKHGYLLFEHAGDAKMRPVDGQLFGQLLHDNGVPVLVLNACQSAMHETTVAPTTANGVHDEIRAIGSLAQAVVDQGVPAVLGMRYSIYVVTAAQYIGQLYTALAKGRGFGQAATEGRKHLYLNPERWVGLQPRPLQDWFVPVIYEATPIEFFRTGQPAPQGDQAERDPVQLNRTLLRYVPEGGFIGRDETLLALDRAFDRHRIALLHSYAGQGKSSTAIEFARWYALTGGLGDHPVVLLTSFEKHTDLEDLLIQIGQQFTQVLESRGIQWSALNDTAARLSEVKKLLREFPILWIWDNVEPVAGFPDGQESQWTASEQRDLRDFLQQLALDSTSAVKMLLTSRRDERKWLGGIPHRIAMPRMRIPDAAKLALKLGEERKLTLSEVAAWQPLLDYCSGNPFTLRVLIGQAVKAGVRGRQQIDDFVEAIRSGERAVEDADESDGRDKSLGASLEYGFRHAFNDDELPVIVLLHLFQGTVNANAFHTMGMVGNDALPELKGKTKEFLIGLLERAKETGLLTRLHATSFGLHPALPWFLRQQFLRHYDGREGRSTSAAASRAWVDAVGSFGSFCHDQFIDGHRGVTKFLELEEANLLFARRLARRNQQWSALVLCMQGLDALFMLQGRTMEWARLVEECVGDFCTVDDEPIRDRISEYSIVMGYRIVLAWRHEHDLAKATALQKKATEKDRAEAATALALPPNASLSEEQRNRLRSLGVSMETLGHILRENGKAECVQEYEEAIRIFQRIADKSAEGVVVFNLGHAYKDIPSIRDLDAAENAYLRSLGLRAPMDALARSRTSKQVGMVHHERFRGALRRNEAAETLHRHAQATAKHYLDALHHHPKDEVRDLGPLHGSLADFYEELGKLDDARKHYEFAIRYFEESGDRFGAGKTRFNMALMYAHADSEENAPARRRDNLVRAQAYAEAAIRDFQHYQGRATEQETKTKDFLEELNMVIAKLPH